MLGIHSDCTDEDGAVDKKRADVEGYNGAEPVVDSGPAVPEGTLEHAVLDAPDERPECKDYKVHERVIDSGPGLPEGIVEYAVLDVLDENSGIRNYPVDLGVIGFLPGAREGIVEQGILEFPSETPNCIAEQGVTDLGRRPLVRVVVRQVAGVLRATPV